MRILISGITGLLGSEIARLLEGKHEITGIAKANTLGGFETLTLDLGDYENVYRAVTRINPDLVIHTAAKSNVDECETDPEQACRVNAIGTRNLALACQRFDAALMYVSTDYVFPGKMHPENGYTEFDQTWPLGAYAKSKLYGEWYTRQLLNKFFIIRTAWLFGSRHANFVSQMAASLKEGKEIRAVTDMVSSPTYVKDLAIALERLIENPVYGTYHLTNSGFADRYSVAQAIARMTGMPPAGIRRVTQKELKLKADRPVFSGLDNYVWKLNGWTPLRPWQEAVAEFLEEQGYSVTERGKHA